MCPKCKRSNIFYNPWAKAPRHNLCTDCGHSWLPLLATVRIDTDKADEAFFAEEKRAMHRADAADDQ